LLILIEPVLIPAPPLLGKVQLSWIAAQNAEILAYIRDDGGGVGVGGVTKESSAGLSGTVSPAPDTLLKQLAHVAKKVVVKIGYANPPFWREKPVHGGDPALSVLFNSPSKFSPPKNTNDVRLYSQYTYYSVSQPTTSCMRSGIAGSSNTARTLGTHSRLT